MLRRESEIRRSRTAVVVSFVFMIVLACAVALPVRAEEATPPPSEAAPPENGDAGQVDDGLFERVRVIASPIEKIPGSVTYVDEKQLRQQNHTDVHRVLQRVPGVNVQEEDGYGLRPNIGMRGTGVERSQKITLLEDGVLIAPAPYSAPSAYYFPTLGRMEGIEVRKGSSSIRQGPFTNGGVLNMISSSIPGEFGGLLDMSLGENETKKGRARLGDSGQRYGWLVETFQMDTDGFKELDGGGSTGFELEDYLVKFRVNTGPQTRTFQALEIKLGRTDQLAHETYLGLTDEDFARNPYRRYAASSEDRLTSDHEQVQVRHFVRPSARVNLVTTVYRNNFARNWRKLDSVAGESLSTVLDEPGLHSRELGVLRGEVDSAADELAVRNNRRDYYSQGVQTVLGFRPSGAWASHDVEVGLRYHEDEEDRFQEEDLFAMSAGRLVLTNPGAPGSQSNRISSARAWAFFAQDTITLDRWTLTPGLRYESIDLSRVDYGKDDPSRTGVELSVRENQVSVWIPGIGANYRLTPRSGLFFGVHRGFAPPAPGSRGEVEPEESVNFELGYRRASALWSGQFVGFFSNYDNLLGSDTLSSGGSGTGDQFNGGAVHVRGLESALQVDVGQALDLSVELPVRLTYTYTDAEFRTSFASDFDGWGEQILAGDELPYLPNHRVGLGAGLVAGRWSTDLDISYVSRMRTQAGQGPIPTAEATDAHLSLDFAAAYALRQGLRVYAQVRNLTDEVYVAARRPAGVRPGLPRTVFAGISWSF